MSIEDTRELTLKVQDWVAFEYNVQAGVTAVDMLQLALRYSPKRIILGELRDTVAAAFLEAMNTGHEGCMATLHANGTEEALTRIETLCLRSGSGWPLGAIQNMIRSTVGAVVQLANVDGCRQVVEIVKVHPRGEVKAGQAYSIEPIYRLGNVSRF